MHQLAYEYLLYNLLIMHKFYSEKKNYSYGRAFLITDVKKNVSLENMKHRSINEDESFYKNENANSLIGPINHEV